MINGIFTVLAFSAFLGVTWWAYTRHNRARFEEASRLPLEDDVQTDLLPPCCRQAKDGAQRP